MKTERTLGPWRNYNDENKRIINAHGEICTLPEANKANARLIAAAPEMLEALRRAAPWLGKLIADEVHLKCVNPSDALRTLAMVQIAIGNAEGQ